MTVVKPFRVGTLKGALKDKFEMLKYCKKEFDLTGDLHFYLASKQEVLTVEARCVRVSQSPTIQPRTKAHKELKADHIGRQEPYQ